MMRVAEVFAIASSYHIHHTDPVLLQAGDKSVLLKYGTGPALDGDQESIGSSQGGYMLAMMAVAETDLLIVHPIVRDGVFYTPPCLPKLMAGASMTPRRVDVEELDECLRQAVDLNGANARTDVSLFSDINSNGVLKPDCPAANAHVGSASLPFPPRPFEVSGNHYNVTAGDVKFAWTMDDPFLTSWTLAAGRMHHPAQGCWRATLLAFGNEDAQTANAPPPGIGGVAITQPSAADLEQLGNQLSYQFLAAKFPSLTLENLHVLFMSGELQSFETKTSQKLRR